MHNGTITAEFYDEYTESGLLKLLLLRLLPIFIHHNTSVICGSCILSVNVQLVSDENCLARFEYGQECVTPFPETIHPLRRIQNHTFSITGLSQDTEYSIESF
jgi:hypothetical protein